MPGPVEAEKQQSYRVLTVNVIAVMVRGFVFSGIQSAESAGLGPAGATGHRPDNATPLIGIAIGR